MGTLTKEQLALIINLLEKHQCRLESDLEFINRTGMYGSTSIKDAVYSELTNTKQAKNAILEYLKMIVDRNKE